MDVVVLYCSDEDKKWLGEFNRSKRLESGLAGRVLDGQSAGKSRYRDWEMFRYWFRGLERNCSSWLGNVYLVVSRESQVPRWLNLKHPKLKVVYHEEFIPKELLPTFNTNTIQFYVSWIKGLGEEFLLSDDDCFFMREIDKEMYFRDGLPVKDGRTKEIRFHKEVGYDKTFYAMLNNNIRLMQRECGYTFHPNHLIKNRLKSHESYLLDKYYTEIYDSLKASRFRHPSNYTIWLMDDLFRLDGMFVDGNPYENSRFLNLTDGVDLSMCDGKDVICLNDTRDVRNFISTKRRVLRYLDKHFPQKSKYEL